MADLPGYLLTCLYSGKLALLAILVSGGIVLQILACVLYNNWWPMLTALMYVILPVPLILFAGSDTSVFFTESESRTGQQRMALYRVSLASEVGVPFLSHSKRWVDATKFLTGASATGSIAIPIILKHAGVITWGAFAMEMSSLFVFVTAIFCFIGMNGDDGGYHAI